MLSVKHLKHIDKYFRTVLYFISIIILLNVKDGKADVALDYFNPTMYKDSTKTWNHYVRMTVVRFVEWTQYSYNNIKQFKNGVFKWSEILLQLRYRQPKMYSILYRKRKTITFVTGKFILHSDKAYNHYFRFNINPRLRLNLTFVLIYFPVNNCTFETLRIHKDGNPHTWYTFCGYHSSFNLYP